MKKSMDSLLGMLVVFAVYFIIFATVGRYTSRYAYELFFSCSFILLGFYYAFKSLRDVRARVRSGTGTPEDSKKLRWNQRAGWCFIAYGTVSGLLHAMRVL